MWPLRSEALCVGISATQMAWRLPSGAQQVTPLLLDASTDHAVDAVAATVADAAGGIARVGALHVVVGSGLARHWVQTSTPGLRSIAELEELVRSRAEVLFGHGAAGVVSGDWHATKPFLCAALPQAVCDLVTAFAERFAASRHLRTGLAAALSRHARGLPGNGWSALYEPEALHFIHTTAGRIDHLRSVVLTASLSETDWMQTLRSELSRTAALAGGLALTEPVLVDLAGGQDVSQAVVACQLAMGTSRRKTP